MITLFVGMSLVVYCWFILCLRFFLINTDPRSVLIEGLVINGLFALFLAVPVGIIFTLGYLVGRACLRHSRRWVAASVVPAILGAAVIAFALRHRLDTNVLMREILACDLPPGARQVDHSYEDVWVEQFAEVSFTADSAEIEQWLIDLRQEPNPSVGVQTIDSVPCNGDNASLIIDWSTGRVTMSYINV